VTQIRSGDTVHGKAEGEKTDAAELWPAPESNGVRLQSKLTLLYGAQRHTTRSQAFLRSVGTLISVLLFA
jgi:hypothetical protein